MAHHDTAHHGHHHAPPPGSLKADIARVGGTLLLLFLCSTAAHYMFAREMLYDWTQNRQNAAAAESLQPGPGESR